MRKDSLQNNEVWKICHYKHLNLHELFSKISEGWCPFANAARDVVAVISLLKMDSKFLRKYCDSVVTFSQYVDTSSAGMTGDLYSIFIFFFAYKSALHWQKPIYDTTFKDGHFPNVLDIMKVLSKRSGKMYLFEPVYQTKPL